MKSKKWSQNFDWRPWNWVIVILSYFCAKWQNGPGGKWKRHPRGENDLAYEILGQNLPEKWGLRKEKFLPVHYYAFYFKQLKTIVSLKQYRSWKIDWQEALLILNKLSLVNQLYKYLRDMIFLHKRQLLRAFCMPCRSRNFTFQRVRIKG